MDNENKKHHVVRYEPTRSIFPIREMMDRFLNDDFFAHSPFALERELVRGVQFPKVDISENDKEIVVVANVPGLSSENIHIDVDDDSLALSGSIEKEKKEGQENGTFYRFEREYGEFRREFALPARVNKDAVSATTKNGVLTIILPKKDADAKKRISVKEG